MVRWEAPPAHRCLYEGAGPWLPSAGDDAGNPPPRQKGSSVRGSPSVCVPGTPVMSVLLPEDEVRPGFGSRGWKACWLWKVGPSRRLRSGEELQRTCGPPGNSSPASRLCCSTGFRATATGGRVQSFLSPFSRSCGPGLAGLVVGTWAEDGGRKEESK